MKSCILSLMVLLSQLAFLAPVSADGFNQFRGMGGSAVVRNQAIPLDWSESQNLAWKIAVPGSGWSQPFIWENKLFVTSAVGDKEFRPKDFNNGVKAPTACSVASDSQRIYFGGSDPMSKGPLFAVHAGATGDISPKKKNDSFSFCDWVEKKAAPGMASPVSTGIHVVVLDNNILRAYDAQTGKKVHERRLGQLKMIAASPLVVDDKVLILDEEGNASLLDSTKEFAAVGSGKINDTFWSTPAIANNSIYLRGINGLYCVRTGQAD